MVVLQVFLFVQIHMTASGAMKLCCMCLFCTMVLRDLLFMGKPTSSLVELAGTQKPEVKIALDYMNFI